MSSAFDDSVFHLDTALDATGDAHIRIAGPGTGKTTTLVESVAERIARGGDPERILVL
ncbi:UvrD-helicase domain-containing protein, partial [Streptomyces nigra]